MTDRPSPIDPDFWTFPYQVASRTMWGECRGEPLEGQAAVAHVLLNRLKDGRWGNSLATVCMWPFQFSCWNNSDPQRTKMAALADDDETLAKLFAIIKNAERAERDPTRGAMFYYADTLIVPPKWASSMSFVRKIGHHQFYCEREPVA